MNRTPSPWEDPCPECQPDRPDARERYRCAAHRHVARVDAVTEHLCGHRACNNDKHRRRALALLADLDRTDP